MDNFRNLVIPSFGKIFSWKKSSSSSTIWNSFPVDIRWMESSLLFFVCFTELRSIRAPLLLPLPYLAKKNPRIVCAKRFTGDYDGVEVILVISKTDGVTVS